MDKPITPAQTARINDLISKGIITAAMPTTSWEASHLIRTAPASKRDKEQARNSGARILTRMTTGELEMTNKVLDAIGLLEKSDDDMANKALLLLRKHFTPNKLL